jgi:hypothetical protein
MIHIAQLIERVTEKQFIDDDELTYMDPNNLKTLQN